MKFKSPKKYKDNNQDQTDLLTVRNFKDHLNLSIFDKNDLLLKIKIDIQCTVKQLTQIIKKKLNHLNILCLASKIGRQIIDYILLLPQHPISFLKNGQQLKIIISQQLKDYNKPNIIDFIFLKCLGQGGSASVYLVRHKANGKLYALKQIDKGYFVQFKRVQMVLRQKKIMSQYLQQFPFVSHLFASFQSQKHLNFLLQFYPGGQLFYHLQQKRLTQNQAMLYFCQITLTFEFIHRQKIIYRDLKPQNIMIDYQGHARLADFGLCKLNLSKDDLTSSYCGSIQYMAPQVKQSIGYNYSVDFYTLGAFLYQMVIGVPPYYNNQPLIFPDNCSKSFKNLVSGLIQIDISLRINNFKTIKQSLWLKNIDWNKIINKQYKMPIKLNPYDSYIHQQFQKISIYNHNHIKQQKYDRLFDFFQFIKIHQNGISSIYINNNNLKKKMFKKSKEKSLKSTSNSIKKKNNHPENKSHSRQSRKSKQFQKDVSKPSCIYTFKSTRTPFHQQKNKPQQQKYLSPTPIINFKRTNTIKHIKSNQPISILSPRKKY